MDKNLSLVITEATFFQPLSVAGQQFLLSVFQPLQLKMGESLYHSGEPTDALYLVVEGELFLTTAITEEALAVTLTVKAGMVIGEGGIMEGAPYEMTARALTDVHLLKLNRADYLTYRQHYAEPEDLLIFLKKHELFSGLNPADYSKLLAQMQKVHLRQNEILFRQHDVSDYLYIVKSGSLAATVTTATDLEKLIGTIEPNALAGEMGALTGEPRTATVRALTDSHLLKISRQDFKAYCLQYPQVSFALINTVIARSQKTIASLAGKAYRHIAIMPANSQTPWAEFVVQLQKNVATVQGVLFLDENIQQTEEQWIQQISAAVAQQQTIIYVISQSNSVLRQICERLVDRVYIVAEAQAEMSFDTAVLQLMQIKHPPKTPYELVLLYATDIPIENTRKWLRKFVFNLHHHLQLHRATDFQRLVRFITGKAIGLVLGGGGPRGWVELGVIKALLEAKIPIDAIGGTSVGALVGACYAIEQDYPRTAAHIHRIATEVYPPFQWKNFTWPIISLLSSKRGTLVLKEIFKYQRIEDLALPFFCIVCNLNQQQEVIYKEGLLWDRLRRTVSIPGIIPPVTERGNLYVDGGIINNLPVDVMRNVVGEKGMIIAVNLHSLREDPQYYKFPVILTFTQALLYKLKLTGKKYRFPSFFYTFLRALQTGAVVRERANSLAANILISADLTRFNILKLDSEAVEALIALGYEETCKALRQKGLIQ